MTAKAKYVLDASLRVDQGKGASRRLRRLQDQIPAIIYGGKEVPTLISLDHKKVMHALENTGYYSQLITLNLDSAKQQVVLKAIQRKHQKKGILHMDFLRVQPTDIIVMRVPIHFTGEEQCTAVKEEGGVVNHSMKDVELRCQAKDLPEFLEIDLSTVKLDQTIHISDLKLPKNVESVALSHGAEHDHPVVSIHLPRAAFDEEPAAEAQVEEGDEDAAAAEEAAPAAPAPAASKGKDKGKEKGKGK